MLDIKTIKNGIIIAREFGMKHAFRRFKDLILIKMEERRRDRLYRKTKPEGKIIKKILNNKMYLNMDDWGIHRDLFLDGIREPLATHHIMEILTKEDVVLEVGANIGYYALIESDLCRKVYAVEPDPRNAYDLKRTIGLNHRDNIEVFEMALGDTKGEKAMYISPKSNWSSFYPLKGAIKKHHVEMNTVDGFLKDKEFPTIVRMDVEGYEINVLRGMIETLKKTNRIFVEIHSQIMGTEETKELIEILTGAGFKPEKIFKYDRPKLGRILSNDHIDKIYRGDKGVYEVFFVKNRKL